MGRSKQLATIIESAPSTLDTLNELAAALGDDANFSTTVTNSIATKSPLADPNFTGDVDIQTTAGKLTVEALGGGSVKLKSDGSLGLNVPAGYNYEIDVNDQEVFRINQSGHLLVAKQTSDGSTTGFEARATGQVMATVASATNEAVMYITQSGGGGNNNDDQGLVVKTQGTNAVSGTGNVLRIAANNATHGTFDNILVAKNNGNVGIGTTSPNQLLEVSGNGKKSRFTRSGSAGTLVEYYYGGTPAGGIQVQSTGLGIGGAARENDLFIKNDGNVGIGTASPASFAKLDILGSGGAQNGANQAMQIKAPSATPGEGVGIRLSATSGSHEAVGIIGMVNNPSGNAGAMTFHTYNLGATIDEQMRIDNLGRVGIGATSPVATHKMTIKETTTENASIVFTDTDDMVGVIVGYAKGNDEIVTGTTNVDAVFGTAYSSDVHLFANNSIGLTLKNGGNVGIGNINPGKKLAVNGTGSFVAGFNNTGLTITGGTTLQNAGKIRLEGAGTGCDHIQIVNDGNSMIVGVERSAGTAIMGGTYGYGSVIGSVTNNPLHFGTNNSTKMTLEYDGSLFFPERSTYGDMTFPICSVSNAGSSNRYLHVQFQGTGGDMLHIKFTGYEYIGSAIKEGIGGGYIYNTSGQDQIYARAQSGNCVEVYQNTAQRVELVIDTGTSQVGNRWGSYIFYGGTDTITSNSPLKLVQYSWTSSTSKVYY